MIPGQQCLALIRGQGWGSDPENSDQTDEDNDPGEFIAGKKNGLCSLK